MNSLSIEPRCPIVNLKKPFSCAPCEGRLQGGLSGGLRLHDYVSSKVFMNAKTAIWRRT
jgi:hypothetical protein